MPVRQLSGLMSKQDMNMSADHLKELIDAPNDASAHNGPVPKLSRRKVLLQRRSCQDVRNDA